MFGAFAFFFFRRPSFNSSKYAKRKHLSPVAATFYFAENK